MEKDGSSVTVTHVHKKVTIAFSRDCTRDEL